MRKHAHLQKLHVKWKLPQNVSKYMYVSSTQINLVTHQIVCTIHALQQKASKMHIRKSHL